MGFVIAIPPVSIARELWRYGEPELALRAAQLTPAEAADIGEHAGTLHLSGEAKRLWPGGPTGTTPSVMLAAIEHIEGRPRPCRRTRRLPEKDLPAPLQLSEAERWSALETTSREMDRRLRGEHPRRCTMPLRGAPPEHAAERAPRDHAADRSSQVEGLLLVAVL
jgi:hypothetical protein